MEIEGKIIQDLPLEEGISKAGNPWRKKGWVLETLGQYPRVVKFDVFGDRVSTLIFEVGRSYAISLDAESREWNGRWYTDLRAFSCRPLENVPTPGFAQTAQAPVAPANPFPAAAPQAPGVDFAQTDPSEDLPF